MGGPLHSTASSTNKSKVEEKVDRKGQRHKGTKAQNKVSVGEGAAKLFFPQCIFLTTNNRTS